MHNTAIFRAPTTARPNPRMLGLGAPCAARGGAASTSARAAPAPRAAPPRRARAAALRASAGLNEAVKINKVPKPPVTLTEAATTHLLKMRGERGVTEGPLVLRVGVKSGGCR